MRHKLSEGLFEFLDEIKSRGIELWCLSNDVSEWSRKLRVRFGLDRYFRGYAISGDMGVRKPDPAIYRGMLEKSRFLPNNVAFVDDRLRNVEAANLLGIYSFLFNPALQESQGHAYPMVRSFNELLSTPYFQGPR